MTGAITVVLIDDHPMFRDGVAHTVNSQPDMRVVGEGATAAEALQLVTELLPDILLLDITIPGGGSLRLIPQLVATCPVTKIVMLTASEADDDVVAALRAGARGYIVKGVAARELVRILRGIADGEVYVTPALAASMLLVMSGAKTQPSPSTGPLDELTEREHQILELVAAGQSNKEIGLQLFLSEKTIKHHMTNILQKLQVRNRVEAALLAQKANQRDLPR